MVVSIALTGPSTSPGAPQNSPLIVNTAVNAALAQLLPLTGGTLSGPFSWPGGAVNVKNFGAVLDGVAFDNTAFNNARIAAGEAGIIVVPAGGYRVNVSPTGGSANGVLWQLTGNMFTTGTTPVNGIGTDVIESVIAGAKFFGRTNTIAGNGPIVRIDGTLNHAGGTIGNTIAGLLVNTSPTGSFNEASYGIASNVTGSKTGGGNLVSLIGFATRSVASLGSTVFGANISANDATGLDSLTGGITVGLEVDVVANNNDTGGIAAGYVTQANQGNRVILDVVGAKQTAGGADAVIGWGVRVSPTNGTTTTTFRRHFAAIGSFSKSAFSTEFAVQQAGAHAIWLADGHQIAFDSAGTRTLLYNAGGTKLQYLNGATEMFSVSDAGNALVAGALGVTGAATLNNGLTTVGAAVANFGSTTGGSVGVTPGTGSIAGILNFAGGGGVIQGPAGKNITIGGGAGLVFNNGLSTNFTYTPSASAMAPNIVFNLNASGSTTSTNPSYISWTGSDTLAAGATALYYLNLNYTFGGSTLTGQRGGLIIKTTQTAASGNKAIGFGGNGLYSPVAFAHQQNFGEGGTDLSQAGSFGAIFSGSTVIRTLATATNLHEVTAWEADMNTAAPSYKKFGWKVTQLSTDVAQGVLDGAFVIENGGTSATNGWHNGFLAIQPSANFPYATDGTLFNAPLPGDYATFSTMANGINLEPLFTGSALRSRGMGIDGAGTIHVGNGYLAATAGGASLDTTGSLGPAEGATISGAALVSGGTSGRITNTVMYGPNGGIYSITGAAAGVVTQLTVLRQPAFNSATPPANPISLTDALANAGNTVGTVQINLTWTQPNALAIQPTAGGKLGFNGATPIVKPTGVAITAAGIHAALTNLGIIAP